VRERIEAFKKHIQDLNDMGVRSTYLYEYIAQSLTETEGEPTQIRRAKGFAHLLGQVEQVVLPYEKIVGSILGMCPVYEKTMTKEEQEQKAIRTIEEYLKKKKSNSDFSEAIVFEEGYAKSFEDDFTGKKSRWSLMSRVHHDAEIEFKDLQEQISNMEKRYIGKADIESYEIGRELERVFKIPYKKEVKNTYNSLPWFIGNHINLNYGRMIKTGLSETKRQILDYLEKTEDVKKREYYEAALITVDAVIAFIKRYANTVEEFGKKNDQTRERKRELQRIANICRKIAEKPAGTYYEAIQFTWMLHVIASLQGGSALSFGRIDQYLYPYYKSDLNAGRITEEEATELMCYLWLKVNEPKMRTVQSLTIGGVTEDGRDAVNDMTRICLHAAQITKMPYPNVGLRVNALSPLWIYDEAVETIKAGCGQPMLLNDNIWIANMKKLGYSEELANQYYNMGCVEIMIAGKQPNWGVTDAIAFPILIENVMKKWENGEIRLDTFEEYMDAYLKEVDEAILGDYNEAIAKRANMTDKCFDPYSSLLIDGCLENGKDMLQQGSKCPMHWSVYAYGIGTVSDSLCAVKKFIYEEKKVSLKEMNDALNRNFEGYEELRIMLDRMTPAYGNGIKEVDDIADQVLTHYAKKVLELNQKSKIDKFVSTLFGYFFHIYHGEITMATPNGRFKGETLSDSMGPSQGKDVKGPTRLMNSVIHLNNENITGGYALNFKVSPAVVSDEKGKQALADLLRAYMESGGPQIQAYMTNIEDLKDARIHPEKHRDLIVRVGGYCEFFVNLDKELQKEIIQRTLYGEEA